tara:strand:+ start:39 stop:440 length:402 start_codon:yes stop_codon:yes gene_type:complete
MAILGGAGNTAGSNPAGTGGSLNYIGDHAYAYSGLANSSSSFATNLDFTTADATYFVGTFQPCYGGASGNNIRFEIKLDGQVIVQIELNSTTDTTPFQEVELLIPPNTRVEVRSKNVSGGTDALGAMIVGRIY